MGSGSMCPKHERWNPDGVCPYCVPAAPERVLVTAKAPETFGGLTFRECNSTHSYERCEIQR